MDTILELQNISLKINGHINIENISIQVTQGEKVEFVGRKGEGKTAFLKMLNNMIEPAKGNIFYKSKIMIHSEYSTLND